MQQVDRLERFIKERWLIHRRRLDGDPPPWTSDKILQKYRFCNVHRESDRVTKWIHTTWLQPRTHDPNIWFAMAVARFVNWPPSLAEIQSAVFSKNVYWDANKFIKALDKRRASKEKVFTSAYMIRAIEAGPGGTKAQYLAKQVLTPLWEHRKEADKSSLRNLYNWLLPHYGMGSFLAAQVVADAKWSVPMQESVDFYTFAAPGPGSARGLSRVLTGRLGARFSDSGWLSELLRLRGILNGRLNKMVPKLDAQNLQNCLCEFDKYERVRLGEGRPRQNFVPNEEEYK